MPRTKRSGLLICLAILCLSFLCFPPGRCLAADVTLAWDAVTSSQLAGYKVHVGTVSGTYTQVIDVGNVTTYTVTGLGNATYYFAVTAYSSTGQQTSFSNEVSM